MEGNRRSSFKRRPNPFPEKGGNKRGKFGDQFSENSFDSETVYRILCHSRRIGSVIGKGGGIVKALRDQTQAKITVADTVPGSEERVIIIYSHSTKKPVKHNNEDVGLMELQCAAQDALLKVHDRIVEEDIVDNENVVIARLLVPNNTVGCLLGKRGDVIQRLRSETGASIRVLPADQLPICAMDTDELVQISAKPSVAKRALYEVSTLLHQNPRKDKPPSGFHPPRSQMTNLPPPRNPMWSERGSSPPMRWRGEYGNEPSRFGPVDFDDDRVPAHAGEPPSEFSMKILCSAAKIGGVIGKGGSNVRQLQQETGTDIHVDDVSNSDERVIRVSAFEALWNPRSRTIDAILILQDKTSDHSEKGTITTRLLIPSSKVGCLLGQGGQIINEMRRRTRADIRVYSKEEKPKCAGADEELVQVSGSYGVAKDALAEIASRFRARYLRDAKLGPEPAPVGSRGNLPVERPSPSGAIRGGRSGGYEPSKGGGREYEAVSYQAPPRDYEPYNHSGPPRDYEQYSHPAPPSRDYEPYSHHAPPSRDYEPYSHPAPPSRDYEPYSHPAPQRDYEPYSHPAPPRDYEPHGYAAPPRDYDPRGYPSPTRDYEPHGYPVPPSATGYPGAVDMKMPNSGRGSAIGHGVGNASEITGTRLKIQDPYAGGSESVSEIRGSSLHLNPTHDSYSGQKRPLHSYDPQAEHYSDINPPSHTYQTTMANPPYQNYQNNPPSQQAHYSENPYQY